MIKHVSFDLWLTLIKSHPQFKQKRAELIAKFHNPNNISETEILYQLTSVDYTCNRFNEMKACKVASEDMYRKVLIKIGNNPKEITADYLRNLKAKINQQFQKYPPVLLNENILPMLKQLRREGKTLNISSNTGYIEADDIIEPLQKMGLYQCFDFCIFSDQINTSKPAPDFFEKITENSGLKKNEILHVGDNLKADYHGAKKFGFRALHINNPNYTFNDIKQALQEN